MGKKILIQPGYYVPDRYIELEDCEILCETCQGTGKTTWVYRDPGPNQQGTCWNCGVDGKRMKCKECGELQPHGIIKHQTRPDLDGLCYNCIRIKLKLDFSKNKNEGQSDPKATGSN